MFPAVLFSDPNGIWIQSGPWIRIMKDISCLKQQNVPATVFSWSLKVFHSGQTRDISNSYWSEKFSFFRTYNFSILAHKIRVKVWIRLRNDSHVMLPTGNSLTRQTYSLLEKSYRIWSGRKIRTGVGNGCLESVRRVWEPVVVGLPPLQGPVHKHRPVLHSWGWYHLSKIWILNAENWLVRSTRQRLLSPILQTQLL